MDEQPSRPAFRAIDEHTERALLRSLLDREELLVALLRPVDDDFEFLYSNSAVQGFNSEGDLVGRRLSDAWTVSPRMLKALQSVLRTGEPWFLQEHQLTVPDPTCGERTAYCNMRAWLKQEGGEDYLITILTDVTAEVEARLGESGAKGELARTEQRMHDQQRESLMLGAANRILDAAAHSPSEEAFGAECLKLAAEITGSAFGFIGELRDDGILYDVAISGSSVREAGHVTFEARRLCGQVLTSGAALFTEDPRNDERRAETPAGHLTLAAFLGVPLKRGGETVGLIAVANRPGGYREEHVALLEGLAPSITSGLYAVRSTRALERSKQLLDEHMNNAPLGVIEFGADFTVIRWSEEAARIFGYAADEVLGRKITELRWVYEDDISIVQAESGRLYSGEVKHSKNTNRNYRKDGKVIWCEWYSSAIHDERGILVSVLSRVLDITARREAEARLHLQNRRAAALRQIAEVAASALQVHKLGQRLADTLSEVTDASVAMVAVADDAGDLSLVGHYGLPDELAAQLVPLPADFGTARVFADAQSIYIERVSDRGRDDPLEMARARGVEAVVALPLVIEDRPIGVLSLGWPVSRQFGPEERSFLQSMAGEIAVGMQNALLFEAERSRRRRIQALHGVLEIAVASLSPAEAAQHILGYLMDHHTFDLAGCWLARGDSLELIAEVNYSPEYAPMFSPMPIDSDYDSPRVHRTGRPVVVRDMPHARRVVREMYLTAGMELGAHVIVPLRARGHTVGTLNLGWRKPRAITPVDLNFYQSLGSELGVVLENADLLNERTIQAKYAEALNRINEAVHSTLEFDEIMQRVVVESSEAAGFDGGAIHLHEGDMWRFAYGYNMPEGLLSLEMTNEEAAFSSAVLAKNDAVIANSATADDPLVRDLLREYGGKSLLAMPLLVRGRPVGVLMTATSAEDLVFEDRVVDFMRKVASTVSLALENARLYDAEKSIADRLQEALLTLPEKVEGIAFAHAYRSATEAARVGGDFYDLFELGGDRVGIVIGDVAGKGINAAVLTSLVKNTVQAHAAEPGKTPGQVLELTNEVIYKSTPLEAFVTVFYGVLDRRDGTLVYANGGHTSGAVLREGGPVPLQVTGPLLGALATAQFRDTWARLDAGNMLFLYTDGLTEARHNRELYGEEQLFSALASASGTSPVEVLSEVVGDVVAFARGKLDDDVAVLAVQLTGLDAEGIKQQRLDV